MRDPQLLTETVNLIGDYRIDLANLLNNNNNEFKTGFFNYLKSVAAVAIKDEEFDGALDFIRKNLQAEVGLWSEEEVQKALRKYVVILRHQSNSKASTVAIVVESTCRAAPSALKFMVPPV